MVSDFGGTSTAPVGVVHEDVVIRFRPHAGKLLWSALAFIALTTSYAYFSGFFEEAWMHVVAVVVYAVCVIAAALIPLVMWLASRIVLTTQRVIMTSGLINRTRREVLYVRVTDVTLRRSASQMAFGTGDVLLGVGTEQPVRIHAVPKPNLVVAAISDLVFQANPRAR